MLNLWGRYLSVLLAVQFSFGNVQAINDATNDICGTVVQNEAEVLDATQVYACLTSTPFDNEVAHELLDYWQTTIEFQSTLTYLKDPPRSYQQQPIDLIRSLDLLRTDVDTGVFRNQFSFESAVQNVFLAAHDGHLSFAGSLLGVFAFGAPFKLVTLSLDGLEIPKIYMYADILAMNTNGTSIPSPLATINGQIAEDFLAVFASQISFGYLEPHGDWNGIMYSPAMIPRGLDESLGYTNLYPGDEITVVLEDGTVIGPQPWKAYNIQAVDVPITNAQQLYNYFVRGSTEGLFDSDDGSGDGNDDDDSDDIDDNGSVEPSTTTTTSGGDPNFPTGQSEPALTVNDETSTITDSTSSTITGAAGESDDEDNDDEGETDDAAGWGRPYPIPDVYQSDLGLTGFVTGYFLNESSVGVLSIPTFQFLGRSALPFSNTIGEFLDRSKEAGMKKIVIDLQQNTGGNQLLATDVFKHFFPNINPFSGMRTRSFDLANEVGVTFTNVQQSPDFTSLNDTYQAGFIQDPFGVVLGEISANTNANFTSWAEYFGPHPDHNDQFSTVFKYNLSSDIFDVDVADVVVYGYGNRSATDPQPYDAKDIVLLTDASCGSACDLFMEMMHHEAGVRTIVVGGLPQYGPMQARGGTRGAMLYTSEDLDVDFEVAGAFNSTLALILPDRSSDILEQSDLTINLADQIRPREYTPVHFSYEAADCRIFWTPQTMNDFRAFWLYAANAAFFNASTCVAHSAEHNNTMVTDLWGPSPEQKLAWAATNPAWVPPQNATLNSTMSLADLQFQGFDGHNEHEAANRFQNPDQQKACELTIECGSPNSWRCRNVERCVQQGNNAVYTQNRECRRRCFDNGDCPGNTYCLQEKVFSRLKGSKPDIELFCRPLPTGQDQICQRQVKQADDLPNSFTAHAGELVDLLPRTVLP